MGMRRPPILRSPGPLVGGLLVSFACGALACGETGAPGEDGGAGSLGLGETCSRDADCLGGPCVAVDVGRSVCSRPCAVDTDCPEGGWSCAVPDGSLEMACLCASDSVDEVCGDGLDNDCDGIAEEGCEGCTGDPAELMDDPDNCGECGHACGVDQICLDASCVCADAALTSCGVECVALGSHPDHCGGCGSVCAAPRVCVDGACNCPTNAPDACGGDCVDTSVDPDHCGACDAVCPAGLECLDGGCGCSDPALTACGDRCVDSSSDTSHCGACGTQCAPGEICDGGSCSCPSGLMCAGTCVASLDPTHCGGCDVVCNAAQACTVEGCRCLDPLASPCGDSCVTLAADDANCGGCGVVCSGGRACVEATCICASPASDCGAAGCVDLASDEVHCGGCGVTCRRGESCVSGVCQCPAGDTWCSSADDCVSLRSDPSHCGGCDQQCAAGQSCVGGACVCPFGQKACGPGGACVDVRFNEAHCGDCGVVCPSGSECSSSRCVCTVAGESACSSGCTDVLTDPDNCDACGNACPAGQSCGYGECRCAAPTIGSPVALGGSHPRVFTALPDGRVAVVTFAQGLFGSASDLTVLVLSSDATIASGPFVVTRSGGDWDPLATLRLLDVAWDGSALGLLANQENGGVTTAIFARVGLDGSVATVAKRIDDDRGPGQVWYSPSTLSFFEESSRLFHDPVAGFTAITVDQRDFGAGGSPIGFSVYSRSLGSDASAMGASMRLHAQSVVPAGGPPFLGAQMANGDIDFFAPNAPEDTIVLRLDATGAPRTTPVVFDAADGYDDVAAGMALGASRVSVLGAARVSSGTNPLYRFRRASAYGSGSIGPGPAEMFWDSRVRSGVAGVVFYRATGADFRIQRLGEQRGWRPLDAPSAGLGASAEAVVPVHTGTDTAVLVGRGFAWPVRFAPCP